MDFEELLYMNSDGGFDIQELEDNAVPTPLTQAKASPLTSLNFEYIDDLPEYPTTHLQGYTYIISALQQTQEEVEQLIQEVQYNRRLVKGQKRPIFCPFFNCLVKRWTWKCSGVLACEFLNLEIANYHHTSVDDEFWEKIRISRQNLEILETDLSKRNAFAFYRSQIKYFKRGLACINQLPTCKPVFKRYPQPGPQGEATPYIGCINDDFDFLKKHYRGTIQGITTLNLTFLENLFNNDIIPPQEECGSIEPLTTRRKWCDRDHPQGPGQLKHLQCDVIFSALVPVDIKQYPYYLFTSHGIHKHPPPPPNKPPERILQRLKQIITRINDPTMTTAQFLRNPQLEEFCREYQVSTLAEMHASLCNKDRISTILYKQRLLAYPSGQEIDGLICLQNTDLFVKDYIQEYYHDLQDTMVLCGFKESVQLLSTLPSFEIDMSFKRLRSRTVNEVLFATFLPDQCKIITLFRVFTSQDTTDGYYLLFQRVFNLFTKITGRQFQFQSIHGTGVQGIILDMDPKQYTGLGRYLQEIDPDHHTIEWQLSHLVIFCQVHFQRTILKVLGPGSQGSGTWSRMMSLLNCTSAEDYDEYLNLLEDNENENVRNWARQKKSPIIKAGLVQACSSIEPYIWTQLRKHTNAVEQSHQKSYAAGKFLTLVEAVKNSAKLDKEDIVQWQSYNSLNIHHSYRTASMESFFLRHIQREKNRKRQRSSGSSRERGYSRARSIQSSSRASSQSEETRTVISRGLQRTASSNIINLEQRRQELELRKLEAEIKKQEEEVRKQELENEARELDLIERRRRLQNLD